VIGGMMMGIFSPTEAGTMGTIGVLLLIIVRRDVSFKMIIKSIDESLRTAVMVLMLIYGSQVLGHFLAITEIPFVTADWVAGLQLNRALIVVIVMFIYLIGGSFMDDLAFMILATPILYPAIIRLGYDPIWFGILVAVTLMIGVIIPPIAISVFIVKNITGLPFGTIYKGVVPFLLSFVVCGALLFLFPDIALYLPRLLMGR
jgi:C4-dicarboxylate transporter DctM subunit